MVVNLNFYFKFGQLGFVTGGNVNTPTLNPNLNSISLIAAGYQHSLVVLNNQQLLSFGNNYVRFI